MWSIIRKGELKFVYNHANSSLACFLSNICINFEMYTTAQVSLIGHSKMELTDVDFSFHWLFENNEKDQDNCLTAFDYFKEMNIFF